MAAEESLRVRVSSLLASPLCSTAVGDAVVLVVVVLLNST